MALLQYQQDIQTYASNMVTTLFSQIGVIAATLDILSTNISNGTAGDAISQSNMLEEYQQDVRQFQIYMQQLAEYAAIVRFYNVQNLGMYPGIIGINLSTGLEAGVFGFETPKAVL
jgi:hypothetical protein